MVHNTRIGDSTALPNARIVTAVDAHVAGSVLRLVTDGLGAPRGRTIAERARWLQRHEADACASLTREPRGHDGITLAVLCEAAGDADAGILFRTAAGFVPLSGCGLLAGSAIAIDRHLIVPRRPGVVRIETAAGVLDVSFDLERAEAPSAVRYLTPPAFVLAGGLPVVVGSKAVRVDVAWAGQFHALVDSEAVGVPLTPPHEPELRRAARLIASAVAGTITLAHPDGGSADRLAGVVFTGPGSRDDVQIRALSVTPGGVASRGPSAEALSAIVAVLHAMGVMADEPVTIESLAGTTLSARRFSPTRVADIDAVQIEIAAQAWLIAEHRFVLSTDDPLRGGFEW
jgi:proline racemase